MQKSHFTYNTETELQSMIEYFEKLHNCKFEKHICQLDLDPKFGYKPAEENFTTEKGYMHYALSEFTSCL